MRPHLTKSKSRRCEDGYYLDAPEGKKMRAMKQDGTWVFLGESILLDVFTPEEE